MFRGLLGWRGKRMEEFEALRGGPSREGAVEERR
jgi:hypothetical protein